MAGSSKPGPLAAHHAPPSLNDGTLARTLTPAPGLTHQGSAHWEPARVPGPAGRRHGATPVAVFAAGRQPSVEAVHKTLRRGDAGPEVQRLQRALNLQLDPSPLLRPDGVFGPFTEAAVLRFQGAQGLRADGVVGRQTWFHLLRKEAPPARRMAVAAAVAQRMAAPAAAPAPAAVAAPLAVADWSLERRFSEVLQRTAPKLPARMQQEFLALLTPTSLAIMAGTLVVWAGAHAFGVGQAVDIVLLLGGAFMIGWAIGDVAKDFASFLSITCTADTEAELDEAATHLARAIAVIGIAAFAALLAKVARRVPSQRRTPAAPAPAPRAPAPRPAAPAPRSAPAPAPAPKPAPAPAPLPPLRQAYVDEVAALQGKADAMRAAGRSPEEMARALHAERRALGEKYKALTPPDKLAEIYARNEARYGDKLGPTIEWLRERGKSWDQIIESACRSGGKDLGF